MRREELGEAAGSAGVTQSRGDILVVDGDLGDRASISNLLQRAGYAARPVATGEEALEAARTLPPQVVVLEIDLPGVSGYEVCREFRDAFGAGLGIIFVTGERVEPLDRVAGLLVGADDYLAKPFIPDELLARVRALIRRATPATAPSSKLTPQEWRVLHLLADGLSQADIASRLVLSPKTVGNHIEHILAKLRVHSRAQAIARAFREHFLAISITVGAIASDALR